MTALTESDVESLVKKAQLQLAVVAAAKTERLLSLTLVDAHLVGKAFDKAIDTWNASCAALDAAVDALLALEAAGE